MLNGGCGYVLKPAIMREEVAHFSAQSKEVIPGIAPQALRVKVLKQITQLSAIQCVTIILKIF